MSSSAAAFDACAIKTPVVAVAILFDQETMLLHRYTYTGCVLAAQYFPLTFIVLLFVLLLVFLFEPVLTQVYDFKHNST